jgi:hypothetical protein
MINKFPHEATWYYHTADFLFTAVQDSLIKLQKDYKIIDPITKKKGTNINMHWGGQNQQNGPGRCPLKI